MEGCREFLRHWAEEAAKDSSLEVEVRVVGSLSLTQRNVAIQRLVAATTGQHDEIADARLSVDELHHSLRVQHQSVGPVCGRFHVWHGTPCAEPRCARASPDCVILSKTRVAALDLHLTSDLTLRCAVSREVTLEGVTASNRAAASALRFKSRRSFRLPGGAGWRVDLTDCHTQHQQTRCHGRGGSKGRGLFSPPQPSVELEVEWLPGAGAPPAAAGDMIDVLALLLQP